MIPQFPTDICVKSTKLTNSAVSTELLNAGIAACVLHNITLQYPEEDALMTDICILPSPPEIVALHLPAETAGSEKQEFIATIL